MPTSALPSALETRSGLAFRPAEMDDARLYAKLSLAWRPDEPADPEVAAHSWAHPTPGFIRERFIVELAGRPAGFARHLEPEPGQDPDFGAQVEVFLVPTAATAERLDAGFALMEERAAEAGARLFRTDLWEDDRLGAEVVESRGYRRDRLSKAWELDLVDNRERLLLMARLAEHRLRDEGYTFSSIADDPDPDLWRRLYELEKEASSDVPHSGPMHVPSLEEFLDWHRSPDHDPRWYFIARRASEVVGLSNLNFPPVQGNVWTGFTAVSREHRGRGVARAVKLALLKQAIEAGVERVRTDNDEENAPMLHINEELGYQRIPGIVRLRKP